MKVYWSRCGYGEGNFGDRLTPLLLESVGIACEWAPPEHAELIGVGSVLEKIPERFKGMIWSSGLMFAHSRRAFPRAQILAVRGPLTRERIEFTPGAPPILGDGGLLSHRFFQPVRKKYKLGLVPHFVDAGDPVVAALPAGHPEIGVIDVCRPPREVIQAIGECERVLSSSLHGLVVADSLGIPSQWMELNHGAETVQGRGFKYRDYYSLFGLAHLEPYRPTTNDSLDSILPRFEAYARPGLAELQRSLWESLQLLAARHPRPDREQETQRQAEKEAWMARLTPAWKVISAQVPTHEAFVFMDEDQLRARLPTDRTIPFLEKDGMYWGPPADDVQAIRELDRLRQAGAAYLVVAWPAFWWLEHYAAFHRHLRENFACRFEDENVILFELRP